MQDVSTPQDPGFPEDSTDFPLLPQPGKPISEQPKGRMGDSQKLLELVRSADRAESRLRFLDVCAEVDDMYDRRPPDDPAALRMDGLGWTNNVDWGGMEFGIDAAIAPEFNLLHDPETYVKLETIYQGYDHSQQKRTVEEEDKRMLDEWEEWVPELGKMLIQRKKYGLGIFYFRNCRSWQFQALHPGNLITTEPSINPNTWSWCAIHTDFRVDDLLQRMSGADSANDEFGKDGWNPAAIRRALIMHDRKDRKGAWNMVNQWFYDAEKWRNEYLSNDLYWSYVNDMSIPGYIVYVKEFDGTVTEYLLTKNDKVGFLFRSPDKQRLTQMSDAFCMFPERCGQTLLREVRGYGIKNLAFLDAENQMNNRLLDAAYLSSSLFVRGGTADDLYNQQEMMIGPITLVPNNLEIQASQMPNTAQALVPITEHLTRLRENAAMATGGEGYGHGPDRETAKAATIRFQQGQRMQNYQVNLLYRCAQKFHRERFKRAYSNKMISRDAGYEEAKEALDRMEIKGVTKEFLASIDFKSTQVARLMGDGDPAKLYADLTELSAFMGLMTEGGKQELLRDMIHAKAGHDRAIAYVGDKATEPTTVRNKAQAQLENGHFESSDARVDPAGDDNHAIHVSEHTSFLEAKVQAMQQSGENPAEIFKTISRSIAHIGMNEDGQVIGGHLGALAQDPTQQEMFQDAVRRLTELVNLRRQIGQQVEAQQQAQAEQELQNLKQPMEEQAKAAKVQAEMQIAAEKARIEIAMKEAEAEFKEREQQLKLELLEAQRDLAVAKSLDESYRDNRESGSE
jgi:hypothetical protein